MNNAKKINKGNIQTTNKEYASTFWWVFSCEDFSFEILLYK